MIKITTFSSEYSGDLDIDVEKFINERNIKNYQLHFYSVGGDKTSYHYCKVIYNE